MRTYSEITFGFIADNLNLVSNTMWTCVHLPSAMLFTSAVVTGDQAAVNKREGKLKLQGSLLFCLCVSLSPQQLYKYTYTLDRNSYTELALEVERNYLSCMCLKTLLAQAQFKLKNTETSPHN